MVRLIATFRVERMFWTPFIPRDAKDQDNQAESTPDQSVRPKNSKLWDPPYSTRR